MKYTVQKGARFAEDVCFVQLYTHTHTHSSLFPDPNSVLLLLESALTMDKIGSLLSKHHRQDKKKVEELRSKLEGTIIMLIGRTLVCTRIKIEKAIIILSLWIEALGCPMYTCT